MAGTKHRIVKIVEQKGGCGPTFLIKKLGISPQALHRHLRDLCKKGILAKEGSPPYTKYKLESRERPSPPGKAQLLREVGSILGAHPAVLMVALFGSWSRGEETRESDIDLLVWLSPGESFNRMDIWNYWDRQSKYLNWSHKVSIITRKLSPGLSIDTLLLDMPEEHILTFDRKNHFEHLRQAVIRWREKNGSVKIPSFGGKHAWKYSTKVSHLDQINFTLDLNDVA